jgi:uncharacterized cupin superfamily protein
MDAINLFTAENPGGRIDVAKTVGSRASFMYVYDIAPGGAACPYHYEYAEEWLLVVDGSVVVREPDGEHAYERGDIVCFPPGPTGAHKVMNRSDAPARTVMFSSTQVPAVSVYPDSGKIGVYPENEDDSLIFVRDSAVPWSHGEDGWNRAD